MGRKMTTSITISWRLLPISSWYPFSLPISTLYSKTIEQQAVNLHSWTLHPRLPVSILMILWRINKKKEEVFYLNSLWLDHRCIVVKIWGLINRTWNWRKLSKVMILLARSNTCRFIFLTRRSNLYQLPETSLKTAKVRPKIPISLNRTICNQNTKLNLSSNPKKTTKKTKKGNTSRVQTSLMIWERSISKWHLENLIVRTNYLRKESNLVFQRVRQKTTAVRRRQRKYQKKKTELNGAASIPSLRNDMIVLI